MANVPGYSTYSVAQMTFSLLLAICQCAQRYDRAVKAGYWQLGIPAEYGLDVYKRQVMRRVIPCRMTTALQPPKKLWRWCRG